MNFFEFNKKFPTQEACIEHFITIRYKQGITCNHCGARDSIYQLKTAPKNFICHHCNNTFSIFKNTIFEKSDTDLRKWFYAIHLFLNGKKGISGYQLQREIGVTYKTAWRILHKLREAMGNDNDDNFPGMFQGITEADETYCGGKEANKHSDKKGKLEKSIVFGMINRDAKRAKAFHVDSTKYYALAEKIIDNVEMGSKLITDEHKSYVMLKHYFKHESVNHSAKEYVKSGDIHTNGIENLWSSLKRGLYGIYHHMSKKHLQAYVNEFTFRYNNRQNPFAFDDVLRGAIV